MNDTVSNWRGIEARIGGRAQLVAVSKTYGAEDIAPVIAAGQKVFGENRVQEAAGKWPLLRQRYAGLELHLIGPLQSNKVAEAVALFDVIQTVDRPKIAEALSKEMKKQNRHLPCFVQVNIGREPQKAGVAPDQVAEFLSRDFELKVVGLMCIPPVEGDPRPYFKELKKLALQHGLQQISMGMSGDFELAIAEGATHVRVGSAIFGARG